MNASLLSPPERARKGVALVLQSMQTGEKAGAIAAAMGISDATLSRIKNERVEEVALLCAHLGIKWVPADWECVSRAAFEFMTTTHERVLRVAPELVWDIEQ